MKLQKQIETSLRIDEPTFVYADSKQNIMELLKSHYVGINFGKCFITDIISILKISECIIESRGPYCGGDVSVCFLAEVEVYSAGDIIFCNVVHRDRDHFVLEAPHIKGYMKAHEKLLAISNGMKIPCVIQKQQYSVGATNISMGFIPWLPSRTATSYHIKGSLTAEDKTAVAVAAAEVRKILAGIGASQPENFFKKMIYPWPTISPTDNTTLTLDDFLAIEVYDGIYGRGPKCAPDDLKVEVMTEAADAITNLDPGIAVLAVVKQFLSVVRMIAEMKEVYSTDAIVTEHKNLWLVYNTERSR